MNMNTHSYSCLNKFIFLYSGMHSFIPLDSMKNQNRVQLTNSEYVSSSHICYALVWITTFGCHCALSISPSLLFQCSHSKNMEMEGSKGASVEERRKWNRENIVRLHIYGIGAAAFNEIRYLSLQNNTMLPTFSLRDLFSCILNSSLATLSSVPLMISSLGVWEI